MSEYGSTPPPPPLPSGGYEDQGAPPPSYLVWSILSTVLWFPLLGIVSIVLARQVKSRWATGDIAGAQSASRKAKMLAISATVLVVIQLCIIGIFIAELRGFSPRSGM
jgi:hypothetical protein